MRRAFRTSAAILLILSLSVFAYASVQNWRIARATDSISTLIASATLQLKQGKIDAAQAFADQLGALHAPAAQSSLLYAIGNAYMRSALADFTQQPFRLVAPRIRLAKAEYRRALQLDPQNWDARYNYAIAAALVRDTEQAAPTAGDEMAHERAAWPDIPGAPNGMP